ncbi:MAG: DUF167 domain-containing protein [Patescibacteria group bacterium]
MKPRLRHLRVLRVDATHFTVAVVESPVEGAVNVAVIAALSEHFGVARSWIAIVRGATSRTKVVDIIADRA